MTDYRDYQNPLGATDPNRAAEDYRRRSSGGTGLIVALTIVALLIVSFIVFAARAPETSTLPDPAPGVTESVPGQVPGAIEQAPGATAPIAPDATVPAPAPTAPGE